MQGKIHQLLRGGSLSSYLGTQRAAWRETQRIALAGRSGQFEFGMTRRQFSVFRA